MEIILIVAMVTALILIITGAVIGLIINDRDVDDEVEEAISKLPPDKQLEYRAKLAIENKKSREAGMRMLWLQYDLERLKK